MEKLIGFIIDLWDKIYMRIALREYRKGNFVDAKDVFKRLGL